MSKVKVAINGFGRIGRLVYRQIYNMEGIDVVAINDLTSPKVLAHLLKYDSAQGRFGKEVSHTENSIIVEGDEIKIYAQKDPAQIPWGQHDVDVVLECTGFFTDKDKAAAHISDWRTPESTLHLLSALGGWVGAMVAQTYLRHKSQKAEFRLAYYLTVIINMAGLLFILAGGGLDFLEGLL